MSPLRKVKNMILCDFLPLIPEGKSLKISLTLGLGQADFKNNYLSEWTHNMRTFYPNILLVAGTGRNVGKTSLICKIIEKYRDKTPLIAIKLTPHLHTDSENDNKETIIFQNTNYKIYKEDKKSKKDSSRFFNSGACEVFYIESKPKTVADAFNRTLSLVPQNSIIVCESGSIINHIIPGVFAMVTGKTNKEPDNYLDKLRIADIVFDSTDINCIFDISKIALSEGKWKIN